MTLGQKSKATRSAAWLAVLAMLFQAILPALHHPANTAIGGIAAFESAQHICFAPGSTAPTDPDKAPSHHISPCALCSAMHAVGGFVPPTASAIPVTSRVETVLAVNIAASLPYIWPRQTGLARAPPVKI